MAQVNRPHASTSPLLALEERWVTLRDEGQADALAKLLAEDGRGLSADVRARIWLGALHVFQTQGPGARPLVDHALLALAELLEHPDAAEASTLNAIRGELGSALTDALRVRRFLQQDDGADRMAEAENLLGHLSAGHFVAAQVEAWRVLGESQPARADEALQALRSLLPRLAINSDVERGQRALRALMRAAGDAAGLLPLLETDAEAQASLPGIERVPQLLELASVSLYATGDASRAFRWLQEALRAAPAARADVFATLESLHADIPTPSNDWLRLRRKLATDLGDIPVLLETLDALAEAAEDEAAAELRWEALERMEAMEPAPSIRAIIERHEATWTQTPALRERVVQRMWKRSADGVAAPLWREAVERLLLEGEDLEKLHGLLKMRAEAAPNAEARRDSRLRLARFELERMHTPDAAAATLRPLLLARGWPDDAEVVELAVQLADALEPPVIDALRRHLRSAGQWEALASLLTRLGSEISVDGHLDFAEAQLLHLNRASAGIRLLETSLARIDSIELVERGIALAEQAESEALLVAFLRKGESLLRDDATKEAWAARRLERQLRVADESAAALDELLDRGALQGSAPWSTLLSTALQDPSLLLAVESLSVELPDDEARILLLRAAEEVGLSEEAGQLLACVAAQRGPLPLETFRSLRDTLEASADTSALLDVLHAQLTHQPPAEALVPWATLQLASPGRDEALAALESAFETDPAEPAVRRAMLEAWQATGQWTKLAEGLQQVLQLPDLSREEQTEAMRRLHAILRGPMDEPDLARGIAADVLELDPTLDEIREEAAEHALEHDDWELRYRVLRAGRELSTVEDRELLFELGTLAADRVRLPEGMLEAWEPFLLRAADDDPRRPGVAERLLSHLAQGPATEESDDRALRVASTLEPPARNRALEGLADRLLTAEDADAAERVLQWGEHAQPGDALWRQIRVRLHRARQEDDSAYRALQDWFTEAPSTLPPAERLALAEEVLRREDGDRQLGVNLLSQLLAEEPDEFETLEVIEAQANAEEQVELARALQQWAEQHAETEAALTRWYRAAELALAHESSLAERCWRSILEQDPAQTNAFLALQKVLEGDADPERLRALLLAQLEHAESDADKAELHRRLAQAAESTEDAEAAWAAVLKHAPSDIEALNALAAFHEGAERWSELVATWEKLARVRSLDREERVEVLRKATGVALEQCEDLAMATRTLDAILDLVPDDRDAMVQLDGILRQTESWESLAAHLDHCARHVPSDDERIALLREEANLLADKLGRPADGCAVLSRVIQLEPRNLPVLEDLAGMQAKAELWSEHLATLEKLADAAVIRELKAEIYVRAAEALHTQLQRSHDALGLVLTAAEMISLSETQIDLGRSMAEESGEWRQWGLLLRKAADLSSDNRRREALEAELGTVIDVRLGETDTAMQVLAESFEEHMRTGPVLTALEELAARHGRRDQLLPFYAKLRERRPRDREAVWHAMSRSAAIAVEDLNLPDRAFRILIEARRFAPDGADIETRMRDVVEKHDLWDEYVEHLNEEWERTEEPAREVELLLAKARAEREHLKSWKAAIESLIGALTTDPFHEGARQELFLIARERDLWPVVIQLHNKLIEEAPKERQAALYLALASVHADERAAWEEALEALEEALLLSPEPAEHFDRARTFATHVDEGRILTTWARLARHAATDDALDAVTDVWIEDATALKAWGSLRDALEARFTKILPPAGDATRWLEVFTEAGEPQHFLDVAQAALQKLREPEERGLWLAAYAETAEAHDAHDHAAVALELLLADAPNDTTLRDRLEQALEGAEAWEALQTALQTRLAIADTEEDAGATALRLAALLEERLEDATGATEMLRGTLDRFPTHQPIRVAVLERLERQEWWDELADVLIEIAPRLAASDPEVAIGSLRRAAELAEDFLSDGQRLQRAAHLWIELAPGDIEALETGVRAAGALDEPETLLSAMRALAGALEGQARTETLIAAALTALEKGVGVAQARDLLAQASENLEETPADLAIAWSFVAEAEGDLPAAIDHARDAVASLQATFTAGRELSEGLQRLGQLLAVDESTQGEAIDVLQSACSSDPANFAARQALEELLAGSEDREALLRILQDEQDHAPTEALRRAAMEKRVRILAFELERADEALPEARALASVANPTPQLRLLLGDVAFLTDAWDDAAASYQALAQSADGETLAVDVDVVGGETPSDRPVLRFTTRLGRVYEEAGALDEAYECYVEANLEDDSYVPARLGMARISLARRNGAAARLQTEEVLDSLPESAQTQRAEALDILGQAAVLEGDHTLALDRFVEAFRADPSFEAAAIHLIEAAPRLPDPMRASELLQEVRETTPLVALQAAAGFTQGHLFLSRPERRDDAVAAFEAVLSLPLEDEDLLRESAEALASLLEPAEAVARLDGVIDRVSHPETRAQLLVQRGRLRVDQGEIEAAAADLAESARLQPHSATPLRLLQETLHAEEHANALAEHLYGLLEACPQHATSARGQIQRALATTLLRRLERPEEARAHLEDLVLLYPDDPQVLLLLLDVYGHDRILDAHGVMRTASSLTRLGRLTEHVLSTLERVHQATDDLDGIVHLLEVHRFAGTASDEEVALLESIHPTLPVLPARCLEGRLYDQAVRSAFGARQVGELLQRASERITLPGTAVSGLVPLAADSTAGQVWRSLQRAFGAELPAFRSSSQVELVRLVQTDATVVVLSEELAGENDEATLRFELARILTLARPEYRMQMLLDDVAFLAFFEAAVQPASLETPTFDAGLEAAVAEWRAAIDGHDEGLRLQKLPRERLPSAMTWRQQAITASVQTGLLACMHPALSYARLLAESGAPSATSFEGLQSLIADNTALRALLAFLVSSRFLKARHELGVSLTETAEGPAADEVEAAAALDLEATEDDALRADDAPTEAAAAQEEDAAEVVVEADEPVDLADTSPPPPPSEEGASDAEAQDDEGTSDTEAGDDEGTSDNEAEEGAPDEASDNERR